MILPFLFVWVFFQGAWSVTKKNNIQLLDKQSKQSNSWYVFYVLKTLFV